MRFGIVLALICVIRAPQVFAVTESSEVGPTFACEGPLTSLPADLFLKAVIRAADQKVLNAEQLLALAQSPQAFNPLQTLPKRPEFVPLMKVFEREMKTMSQPRWQSLQPELLSLAQRAAQSEGLKENSRATTKKIFAPYEHTQIPFAEITLRAWDSARWKSVGGKPRFQIAQRGLSEAVLFEDDSIAVDSVAERAKAETEYAPPFDRVRRFEFDVGGEKVVASVSRDLRGGRFLTFRRAGWKNLFKPSIVRHYLGSGRSTEDLRYLPTTVGVYVWGGRYWIYFDGGKETFLAGSDPNAVVDSKGRLISWGYFGFSVYKPGEKKRSGTLGREAVHLKLGDQHLFLSQASSGKKLVVVGDDRDQTFDLPPGTGNQGFFEFNGSVIMTDSHYDKGVISFVELATQQVIGQIQRDKFDVYARAFQGEDGEVWLALLSRRDTQIEILKLTKSL